MVRKLRIAFSVVCAIVCLLLIGLWVRSYSRCDIAFSAAKGHETTLGSNYGYTYLIRTSAMTGVAPDQGTRRWKLGGAEANKTPNAFEWTNARGKFNLTIPYRYPTLAFAAAACVPWLKIQRRFRLRTLLVTTTLVAVVLALVVLGI